MATTSKKRTRKVSRTKKICLGCLYVCDDDPLTVEQFNNTSFADIDIINWHNIPEHLDRKQFMRYYKARNKKIKKHNICRDYVRDSRL